MRETVNIGSLANRIVTVDFIFMLTRDDRTLSDSLAVVDAVIPLGLNHIGFKDTGVDHATLHLLNQRIQASGAYSYLEIVSTERRTALDSTRLAVDIGVDGLLGGTWVPETLALLADSRIAYYPFPGTPLGHPTVLRGSPRHIAADCQRFIAQGCTGVDLLAYRAVDAAPLTLVRHARQALGHHGRLICAGGIDSIERIQALQAACCDAFTVGSAVFTGAFCSGSLQDQLATILAAVE